jgi:hypothetical protein
MGLPGRRRRQWVSLGGGGDNGSTWEGGDNGSTWEGGDNGSTWEEEETMGLPERRRHLFVYFSDCIESYCLVICPDSKQHSTVDEILLYILCWNSRVTIQFND